MPEVWLPTMRFPVRNIWSDYPVRLPYTQPHFVYTCKNQDKPILKKKSLFSFIISPVYLRFCNQANPGLPMWSLDRWPNNYCWRKQVFINRVLTLVGGTGSSPAQSLVLPWDPAVPLLPKRLHAKTMPRSSPSPHLFLSWLHKQVSISLEGALMGLRVTILSQQLSPPVSWACSSQPPHIGSGKHMLCYTGSRCSPGRHMSQWSGFSIHPSEKQKYFLSLQIT